VSNWRPFSFIFNRGNRKVGWVGTTGMLFLVKNSLVPRRYSTASFFCLQSSGRSLRTFLHSREKRDSSMLN
jgi:hypothetical protein